MLSSRHAEVDGQDVVWKLNEPAIRLPVYLRYSSALVFAIGSSSGMMGIGGNVEAVGNLMCSDLLDNEHQEVKVPIVKGKDLKILRQNVSHRWHVT